MSTSFFKSQEELNWVKRRIRDFFKLAAISRYFNKSGGRICFALFPSLLQQPQKLWKANKELKIVEFPHPLKAYGQTEWHFTDMSQSNGCWVQGSALAWNCPADRFVKLCAVERRHPYRNASVLASSGCPEGERKPGVRTVASSLPPGVARMPQKPPQHVCITSNQTLKFIVNYIVLTTWGFIEYDSEESD